MILNNTYITPQNTEVTSTEGIETSGKNTLQPSLFFLLFNEKPGGYWNARN